MPGFNCRFLPRLFQHKQRQNSCCMLSVQYRWPSDTGDLSSKSQHLWLEVAARAEPWADPHGGRPAARALVERCERSSPCPSPAASPTSLGTVREDNVRVMPPGDGALKCLGVCQSICAVNKYLPATTQEFISASQGLASCWVFWISLQAALLCCDRHSFLRQDNTEEGLEKETKAPSFVSGMLVASQVPLLLEKAENFRQIPRYHWIQWLYCSADGRGLLWPLQVMALLW